MNLLRLSLIHLTRVGRIILYTVHPWLWSPPQLLVLLFLRPLLWVVDVMQARAEIQSRALKDKARVRMLRTHLSLGRQLKRAGNLPPPNLSVT